MSRSPSPDGVVAYHAALSRLRPGFKSRSGRHSLSTGVVAGLPPIVTLFIDAFPSYEGEIHASKEQSRSVLL